MDPPALAKLTISSPSPTSPSDPPLMSPYLPTPPPETHLPSSLAIVYVPTPIHSTALAYARTREMLDKAGKLMGLTIVGVGYDSIDIEGCKERDATVMNRRGANSQVVAELTLSLTLVLRRVPELDRRLRAGETMLSINNFGRTLRGKVHAFDCTIHTFSPTSLPTRWSASDPSGLLPHTRHSSLSSMLLLIDILTLHCPLTPSSHNMISTEQRRMMKKGSVLVNMSRGAVVDEIALADELRREQSDDAGGRKVWRAASDVFAVEPVRKDVANGLLELDNFIGTPRIGDSTVEAQIDVCLQAIDQLADFFDGFPAKNRVC
ncbi:phosphoglycerate dehydrogenase [Cryptococcus neoformans]|nr:phosphoglycerate dehydrogenase [Cryptococcus neoformans var. grubii]OXC59914.1 phosphoglycerate dehydrogenase [Cryptococcus neoformans var. grubii MW-RSA852]